MEDGGWRMEDGRINRIICRKRNKKIPSVVVNIPIMAISRKRIRL
jgi:hypothetical protein